MSAALALANLFVAAYLLDGGLSLLDGALHFVGLAGLHAAREWVAAVVFYAAPVLLLVSLVSSQLPARLLAPLALGVLWLNLGALPVAGWLPANLRDVALSGVQLALAAPTLLWLRSRGAWRFEARILPPPRPRRALLAAGLLALGLPVLAAGLLLAGGIVLTERATAGFVSFGWSGVRFDERHYAHGDREVQLVGMGHIGRRGVYDALLARPDDKPTVILAEGVTDEHRLLPSAGHQQAMALALGLDAQPPPEEMIGTDDADDSVPAAAPAIENADLDVSAFRPSTLDFLRLAFRIDADPSDRAARRRLEALVRRGDAHALYRSIAEDVLDKRNQHLLERIDAALPRYARVVVPWGVLHLADIEAGLFERGFELTSRETRSFLSYAALLQLVARMQET